MNIEITNKLNTSQIHRSDAFKMPCSTKKQFYTTSNSEHLNLALHNLAQLNKSSISFGTTSYDKYNKPTSEIFYALYGDRITPDKYQLEAADKIRDGHSVVVSAPTGTGKTLIAEFAIMKNLFKGEKTYYTTPLKALSEQKYKDFKKLFGDENVGIMTGDKKENIQAPVIVMTTEIYRNMLKLPRDVDEQVVFKDLSTVIFDEFHYMSDFDRGVTWEESIMYSPKHVQLIPLSATVNNVQDITDWMKSLNLGKEVSLVKVPPSERNVPLNYYAHSLEDSAEHLEHLNSSKINLRIVHDLLNKKELSGRLTEELEYLNEFLGDHEAEDASQAGMNLLWDLAKWQPEQNIISVNKMLKEWLYKDEAERFSLLLANACSEKLARPYTKNGVSLNTKDKPEINYGDINKLLSRLDNDRGGTKLPAIVFVFSRKDCNYLATKYAESLSNGVSLTPEEMQKLRKHEITIDRCMQNIKERMGIAETEGFDHKIIDTKFVHKTEDKIKEYAKRLNIVMKAIAETEEKHGFLGTEFDDTAFMRLVNGVGVHHAGMLPSHKALIETLFNDKRKPMQVVFATETLSAGINMPAKTTIITSLTKPVKNPDGTEVIRRPMNVNEFHQMAGRAGRRGFDTIGNSITLVHDENESIYLNKLVHSSADPIKSQYTPTFDMLVDLLNDNHGYLTKDVFKEHFSKTFYRFNSKEGSSDNSLIEKSKKLKEVMLQEGYISPTSDPERFKVEMKGDIIAKARGTNNMFFTEILANGALFNLTPEMLAASIAAFTNDRIVDTSETPMNPELVSNDELKHVVEKMVQTANHVNLVQDHNDLYKMRMNNVFVDASMAKGAYEWLMNAEANDEKRWEKAVDKMIDYGVIKFEGDLFRTLNMTVDILNQVASQSLFIVGRSDIDEKQRDQFWGLYNNAKAAVGLLNKPPLQLSHRPSEANAATIASGAK